jgi:hypothetical protein
MFNSIKHFIQFGNNTQINNISINPKINVSIKRVEKDFFDGNFNQAMNDLNLLIEDNSSELLKVIKYQLLLLKMSFLLQFRKIDEFEELIELIENKYSNELKNDSSTKFQEFKLTLMAFNKNDEFFKLSKELKSDTPNSKPQGHFDIVFYLNNGDLNKAKEIFEEEIKNTEYRDKLLLNGGHIYSNLYKYNENDIDNFNYADKYYKEVLEKEELSFLDKLQIEGFYATYLLNSNLQHKILKEELPLKVKDYKKSLDIILENKEYFNVDYIKTIFEPYIHILAYLGLKDEYNEFYKKYKKDLSIKHYIQYCVINEIEYEHSKIQESILNDYQIDNLLVYSSLILNSSNKNIEEITKFFQINKEYLYRHSFILYAYTKGQILLNNKIETNLVKYLEEYKYNDTDTLLTFINIAHYNHTEILNKDIDKLIELSENSLQDRILDIIKLLKKLNKRKQYIDLALSKQGIFDSIIFETLKICYIDENLHFKDFEYFINNIDNKCDYSAIIGNIYVKHDKHETAFDYYYLEYEKNTDINIMLPILQVVLINYSKTNKTLRNHDKVFNSLIAKIDELSLEQLFFILQYSITIIKDTKQVSSTINQRLLKLDIKNQDNNIKVILSNFYTQTMWGSENFKSLFMYSSNKCLYDGKTTYIISSEYDILEENKSNFIFSSINDDEYFLKKNDTKLYHEESLLHRICVTVAFNCDNPNMFSMDTPKEVLDLIDKQSNDTKNLFQSYSEGNTNIGLFELAHKSYKNYFTLIPYLLNSKNIKFNSLKINYLSEDKKKILTFSSIIFLDEIGKLDDALKREDIVIQKTLTNWLKKYLDKISVTKMPIDISYLDEEKPKFIPYTNESIKIAENFKSKVSSMLIKLLSCNKIDDTSENLPIKGAFSHLAPHVGTQEYQALAYCINHNYQIISENNIFNMLFEKMKFNNIYISNSIALLKDILSYEDYRSLIIDLDSKNYKY